MHYLLLISEPRGQRAERSESQGRDVYGEMLAYAESLKREGVLRGVESLQHDGRGVRLQVRDGDARWTDGPFSEVKEMIGGFFLIDVPDLAAAKAVALRCPAARWATVEIRPAGPCYS